MTYRIHNSPIQGDLCGVRSPYGRILRRGYRVEMAALPGLTTTSFTKEPTKALVSVSSLVLRNSLISAAKAAMAHEGHDGIG